MFFLELLYYYSLAAVCCHARRVHVALDWETGTVDSNLSEPLKPSFSINGDGYNPPKNPASDYCQQNKNNKKCWPAVGWQILCKTEGKIFIVYLFSTFHGHEKVTSC